MPAIIHPSDIWEHSLTEILNHDTKSESEIIMRAWVKHKKLGDFNSLSTYDLNDFTLSGILCYYQEKADSELSLMMRNTPLKELYNLWRYIQHVMLESQYDYDGDEFDNPLDEQKFSMQTIGNV